MQPPPRYTYNLVERTRLDIPISTSVLVVFGNTAGVEECIMAPDSSYNHYDPVSAGRGYGYNYTHPLSPLRENLAVVLLWSGRCY